MGDEECSSDFTTIWIFPFAVENFFVMFIIVYIDSAVKCQQNHLRNLKSDKNQIKIHFLNFVFVPFHHLNRFQKKILNIKVISCCNSVKLIDCNNKFWFINKTLSLQAVGCRLHNERMINNINIVNILRILIRFVLTSSTTRI